MKLKKIFVGFLIGVFSLSYGGEEILIKSKIEKLIQEVKKAPPSERYKKMNQLKLFIKKLKAEERINIMKQLHRQLSGGMHMHEKMHIGNKMGHFSEKERMEMRNMMRKHQESMRHEMGERRHSEHGGMGDGKGRWGGGKNKNHGGPWNHNR